MVIPDEYFNEEKRNNKVSGSKQICSNCQHFDKDQILCRLLLEENRKAKVKKAHQKSVLPSEGYFITPLACPFRLEQLMNSQGFQCPIR